MNETQDIQEPKEPVKKARKKADGMDIKKLMPLKVVFLGSSGEMIIVYYDAHLFPIPQDGQFVTIENDKMELQGHIHHVEWGYRFKLKCDPDQRLTIMIYIVNTKVTIYSDAKDDDNEQKA